jgi:hypothetical protein
MSDELVLTPGGYRPKSFVNAIEPGHGLTVLDTGEFAMFATATNKVVAQFARPPGLEAQFTVHGPNGPPPTQSAPPPGALPGGWQTYACWGTTEDAITYFATQWSVPPAPSTSSGQTIFLFNGIQNAGANSGILQPVLQWGKSSAGGGAYWSVASWYVTASGQAFNTNLVPVNTGDELLGIMTETGSSSGNYNYNSTFQGIPNTTLPIKNIALLYWANETLECYGLTKCSDFPATTETAMGAIEIRIGSTHPALMWSVGDLHKNCGQHTVIASDANPNGEVDLYYEQPESAREQRARSDHRNQEARR